MRDAQLSQAIDKMYPHVKSADGTEAVSSDPIQEDSIGKTLRPTELAFCDGFAHAHAALPKMRRLVA